MGGMLQQVLVLLSITVLAVMLLMRLRLPPILGYLLTGILIGPHGLGWLDNSEDARRLAEFGVVFLLFTSGLEFSLPKLAAMKNELLLFGTAQVATTAAATAVIAWLLGAETVTAVVLGGAAAMTSTAVIIKQLSDQQELTLPHGRLAVGISLFQDIAAIPFLVMIPTLAAGTVGNAGYELVWALGKGAIAFLLVLIIGRRILRPLFHSIANTRSAEIFTLAVLLVSLTAAVATNSLGLSYALGAFLAGMMLGETEFRHQVEADIRPFRDVLLGLFFITVGMLLDISILQSSGWLIALSVLALLTFKAFSVMLMTMPLHREWQMAARTGLVLSPGGEFGFALITLALTTQAIAPEIVQPALAVIVLSMVGGVLLVRYNALITRILFGDAHRKAEEVIERDIREHHQGLANHVIIVGYGRVGQNIARFLEKESIEYIALDLDPYRVRTAHAAGDPVYYGDATHHDILVAAGIHRARVLVNAYYELSTGRKVLHVAKQLRPDIPVIIRTRDDTALDELMEGGATEVVPETMEASLMMVAHVLSLCGVPLRRVLRDLQEVREHRYALLRNVFRGKYAVPIDSTHAFREELFAITLPESAQAIGMAIHDINLDEYGVVVTALKRDNIVGRQPDPETILRSGDTLVLWGTPEDLERAEKKLLEK